MGCPQELPFLPYDSATDGDTKAEENAWMAATFSWAAVFAPEEPSAAAWERKGRQMAYDSIARPSDGADVEGLKVTTVTEDFVLTNHFLSSNPYDVAATLHFLRYGELPWRLTGREAWSELRHNIDGLAAAYARLVDLDFGWNRTADPAGDATLFPMWGLMNERYELSPASAMLGKGTLWGSPDVKGTFYREGDPLSPELPAHWTAITRARVILYYLMGSYLWRQVRWRPARRRNAVSGRRPRAPPTPSGRRAGGGGRGRR